MKRFVLCAALLVPIAARAQADRVAVQAGTSLDHDSATVGDVVRLSIRIRAPRGSTINFPAAVDSLGPVQSVSPPTVVSGSDTATYADRIATYQLAAWDIGLQPIRLGEVLVQTDAGDRRITLTLPSLFVKSVLPADTALRVPKPPRPLLAVTSVMPWWWWVVAAIVAVALILLLWWWRKRRRANSGLTGDPYVDAMAAFARVERMGLLSAGEPGQFAALMADVARRYLSDRISGASLAQTSTELSAAVRASRTVLHDQLRGLLDSVDAVKFARAYLNVEQAQALGADARAVVVTEHERSKAQDAASTPQGKAA